MMRRFLKWLDRDFERTITPRFDWNEVVDHRVYRIRWRDREYLYATRERANLAYEWLCVHNEEPQPIRWMMGYPYEPPSKK